MQIDILVPMLNPGRFAPDPVRPLDISPQWRFAPVAFRPPGRFAPRRNINLFC